MNLIFSKLSNVICLFISIISITLLSNCSSISNDANLYQNSSYENDNNSLEKNYSFPENIKNLSKAFNLSNIIPNKLNKSFASLNNSNTQFNNTSSNLNHKKDTYKQNSNNNVQKNITSNYQNKVNKPLEQIVYRTPLAKVGPTIDETIRNKQNINSYTVQTLTYVPKNSIELSELDFSLESSKKTKLIRTTAYSHQQKESWAFGRKSAAGTDLKYGKVRSAAADWSRYPLGTRFKIHGLNYEYVIDDYGSALCGTDTIDIYHPTLGGIKKWGVRNVPITILKWGDVEESRRILDSRKHVKNAGHVRRMLKAMNSRTYFSKLNEDKSPENKSKQITNRIGNSSLDYSYLDRSANNGVF